MTLTPLQSGPELRRSSSEASSPSRTPRAFRTVGYTLLLLSLLDWVMILVPFQPMEPSWEFQTIGALVERLPVPLIALVLVFFGESQQRHRWEFLLVKALSWLSFLLGLLFLIMLPLGLVNTSRLHEQSETRLSTVYEQRLAQIKSFETQVGEADDAAILQFLEQQGQADSNVTPAEVREQATAELDKIRQQVYLQTEAERTKQWRSLLENSVKWNLGAVIGGFAFLYLWRLTRWARSKRRRS